MGITFCCFENEECAASPKEEEEVHDIFAVGFDTNRDCKNPKTINYLESKGNCRKSRNSKYYCMNNASIHILKNRRC